MSPAQPYAGHARRPPTARVLRSKIGVQAGQVAERGAGQEDTKQGAAVVAAASQVGGEGIGREDHRVD